MKPASALDVFIVTGEESGDALGARLMAALKRRGVTRFRGVGGAGMAREGLESLFPLSDIAVMGLWPVVARLPSLLARLDQTAKAITAARPDMLVIIDSPDFTQRVARRVRKALPGTAIVNYVSPTVWAWRPGRARAMASYIDHVLALLPFEPAAHERLGGPPCSYVGHPLIERLDELRPAPGERALLGEGPRRLLVLPGSRAGVLHRHMPLFGETLRRLDLGNVVITLPTVPHLSDDVRRLVADWPVRPEVVTGEAEKLAAFRAAHAALSVSGTATLELALSGVPLAAAYRVEWFAPIGALFVKIETPFILLPNLILGEKAIPEFVHRGATPGALATALAPLLEDGPARRTQLAALSRLDALMRLDNGESPSERAARIVLETAGAA